MSNIKFSRIVNRTKGCYIPDKGMIDAKTQKKGILHGESFIRTCLLFPYDEIGDEIVIDGVLILIEYACGNMHSPIFQDKK